MKQIYTGRMKGQKEGKDQENHGWIGLMRSSKKERETMKAIWIADRMAGLYGTISYVYTSYSNFTTTCKLK